MGRVGKEVSRPSDQRASRKTRAEGNCTVQADDADRHTKGREGKRNSSWGARPDGEHGKTQIAPKRGIL